VLAAWRHVPAKRQLTFIGSPRHMPEKAELSVITFVRTSDPTLSDMFLCVWTDHEGSRGIVLYAEYRNVGD
jgi:hypothetical protein